MSMYRQLWLAIMASMLLALLGSLLAATLSARAYLSEQLSVKNSDNAAALALSLSQARPDAVSIELAVSALFDSGHYELIRVTDPHGAVIVEKRQNPAVAGVPNWFAKLLPIRSARGLAQISDGWKQVGAIELVSDSRFAYRALWRSTLEMAGALTLAGLVGGYLGALVLRRLRKPLNAVIGQAKAITERRFVTIEEPDVPELHHLASAMNTMVARLKTMFEEEAARLETMRRQTNCDALTGLSNRAHFLARLQASLTERESPGGSLLLVRVADLGGINRHLGHQATDELLKRFGEVIASALANIPDGLGARLNGADYALLISDHAPLSPLAEEILDKLARAAEPFIGDQSCAYIGYGHYPAAIDAGLVLARIDAAVAAAEAQGINAACEARFADDEQPPRSGEEWKLALRSAIEGGRARLVSFPVVSVEGRLLHHECPLRLQLEADGSWLPAGAFLPMAERLGMTSLIDLTAVSLGLEQLAADPDRADLSINLSVLSLEDADFRRALLDKLRKRPQATARLWLEVAETGVARHFNAFRSFAKAVKDTGCRLGIEHFGRHFSQIGMLHGLGLDYLKVDASFVRGLDEDGANRTFLQGLSIIAHGIGLTVIAEGVSSEADLRALGEVGFDGATGPAIKE